ncbi:MAG: DUF2937 family protein [Rhodospirillales bacterium]|nr:DUF2937 family protein [Rhodospirillales bacterium]
MIKQLWTIIWAFLFAISFSQVPTFIQQYEQRLGGAVHELQTLVERYTADAMEEELTLMAYLRHHQESTDSAIRRTGETLHYTLTRFEKLYTHQKAMEDGQVWEKPMHFVQGLDGEIAKQAWDKYNITLTLDIYYSLFGILFGLFLNLILGWIFGSKPKSKKAR